MPRSVPISKCAQVSASHPCLKDPAMDDAGRARAIEKRKLLQQQRKRQHVSDVFRRVGCKLRGEGVRFTKLMPATAQTALGTLASGPGRDERLLWEPIPNATCRQWDTERQRANLIAEAVAACTTLDAPVAVIWHTAKAALRLSAANLCTHSAIVLGEGSYATWIVDARGAGWLIEVAGFDQEVCWTRAMPPSLKLIS